MTRRIPHQTRLTAAGFAILGVAPKTRPQPHRAPEVVVFKIR